MAGLACNINRKKCTVSEARLNLTSVKLSGNFGSLPQNLAGRPEIGARQILENSTACHISMPSINPVDGAVSAYPSRIPLVDRNKTDNKKSSSVRQYQLIIYGEFDPGSGRTLAACLTHASRTVKAELAPLDQWRTGE
jgi:hypothetical protein